MLSKLRVVGLEETIWLVTSTFSLGSNVSIKIDIFSFIPLIIKNGLRCSSDKILSFNVRFEPSACNIERFWSLLPCAADVFCYPAISKGMAVMEAMASNLPVVAKIPSRKPYVVKNNASGLLTRSSDCKELATKLTTILKNKDKARTMGMHGRKTIEKDFNLNNTVVNVMRTYHEAINSVMYASSSS